MTNPARSPLHALPDNASADPDHRPVNSAVAWELASSPASRRWLVLVVIAIAQLMIVVDASIVNIALPSAQRALHITNANRQWVVTAYTLSFGSLLLLGGRIADFAGRKRMLMVGLVGFATASAVGGLAPDAGLLFTARAIQGGFAAVMAPAALSLLSVTFTDPKERAKAFGVYGSIAGGGLAIGLILGGVLTQYASWRWCLLVNTPIAVLAATAGAKLISESRAQGDTRYDIWGALSSTAGLVALVYGVTRANTSGWSSALVIGLLITSAALLGVFVLIEKNSSNPLLPMRVITERNRAGAFLTSLLVGVGLFGMFLFLTYYLQGTLGYSALETGFAFLPFSAGVVTSAAMASVLLPRLPPRWLMSAGLVLAGGGMLWFTRIGVHTAYATHVLPAEIVMSLGLGLVFVPISNTALLGVAAHDSGVASAMINTTQQVGGSIGTALLNTIALTATTSYVTHHGVAALATGTVHGYTVAFAVGAGFLALGLVLAAVLVNAKHLSQGILEGIGV